MVSSDLYGSPFDGERGDPDGFAVTPFTGVWIEMHESAPLHPLQSGHTLHGCVD